MALRACAAAFGSIRFVISAIRRLRPMRAGLTVVGICFLISIGIAVGLMRSYGPEWSATQDLFMGLTYFMEVNGGRFPATEDEFVQSPFVERLPDGKLRIKAPATTEFNNKLHG